MTVRLPISKQLEMEAVDGTLTYGPFAKNGYIETIGDREFFVKRPGLTLHDAAGSGQGNGVLSYVNPDTGEENLLSFIGSSAVASVTGPATTAAAVNPSLLNLANGTTVQMAYASFVVFGGYLWAIGGRTVNSSGQYSTKRFAVYYSNNGTTWTAATDVADSTSGYPRCAQWCTVVYNNKIWLLGGYNSDSGTKFQNVWTTIDGVTWTQVTATPGWTANHVGLTACVHNNEIYVFVGPPGSLTSFALSAAPGVLYHTTNGTSYTSTGAIPTTRASFTISGPWLPLYSVGGNLVFAAWPMEVTANQYSFYSTDDGATWNSTSHSDWDGTASASIAYAGIAAFVSGGVLWVLVFKSGTLNSSAVLEWQWTADGITWTAASSVTESGSAASIRRLGSWISTSTGMFTNLQPYKGYVYSCDGLTADNAKFGTNKIYRAQLDVTTTATTGNVVPGKYDYSQTYDKSQVMFKTATAGYYLDATTGQITQITDADYPTRTARGLVYMNGLFYVMDTDGTIWNSAEDDPGTWPSTDFISAEFEPDGGVAIAKQEAFVVAFGTYTTQKFWDAGTATGSPLLPQESSTFLIGCANGDSLQEMESALVFVGQSKTIGQTYSAGKFVAMMQQGQMMRISTPAIDRILEADGCDDLDAVVFSVAGHTFYALTLHTSSLTLVFHSNSKKWYTWEQRTASTAVSVTALSQSSGVATATATSHGFADGDYVTIAGATPSGYNGSVNIRKVDANTFTYSVSSSLSTPATGTITATGSTGGSWPMAFGCNYQGDQILLGREDGNLYILDSAAYQDNSVTIDFMARLDLFDGGNNERKFMGRLDVIADKSTGTGKYLVRTSDDEWQSFSKYRIFDATLPRVGGERWGAFRRRSFDIRHTANEPARMEALEVDIGE